MLSRYDYLIIAGYLLFVASMGWTFKRFNKGSNDYFAGGFRMSWWLLGTTSMLTNFTCWTFTGAAAAAYSFGLGLILGFYLNDVVGFVLAALWYAPRLRQLRVVTGIDAIRMRFGRRSEQFFGLTGVIATVLHGAVGLVAFSIILSTVYPLHQIHVIVVTGAIVLVIALVGGNWAVAGSGFVQFMMIACITIVAAVMTIVRLGGLHAFLQQIPPGHWRVLYPAGSIQWDWLFMVSGWLASIYWRNNLSIASKYIPARDSRHARWSALVPLVGYLVMPLFWFIPPVAAHTLAPTLMDDFRNRLNNPAEAAYFAVCARVLPQGLLGLLVAAMFSTTMGSMDGALNKNAGVLVKNVYQSLINRNASDRQLFFAGHVATLVCGLLTIAISLLIVGVTRLPLFDAFQYINAYVWMPLGVPSILGMLMRRTPPWSGWATVLFGVGFSLFLFEALPLPAVGRVAAPMIGDGVYHYMTTNQFAITNLVGLPVTSLFFVATRLFYRPAEAAEGQEVDAFFARMETPVDFEKEVGADNTEAQARVLGRVMGVYGCLIALILLVPNAAAGRIGIAACAGVMLLIGAGILAYAERLRRKRPAVERLVAATQAGPVDAAVTSRMST